MNLCLKTFLRVFFEILLVAGRTVARKCVAVPVCQPTYEPLAVYKQAFPEYLQPICLVTQ